MRLSTRGAAHHCPADAVTAWGPRRLSGRGGYDFQSQPPRVRPMSLFRSQCGLGLRAAPQLHR